MARKRQPKSTANEEAPTFIRFNRFPWEIRRMIWEQALPPPIPQVLIYKPTTFPRWDPVSQDWAVADGPPAVPIIPPAILHATQESRAFALEHILIRKVKKASTRSLAPDAYHNIVCRPFDRDTDALFVHRWHFPSFVEVYMATTPSVARHLVFDSDVHGVDSGRDYPRLWLGFPHIGWRDFLSAVDQCQGLRSVAVTEMDKCAGLLDVEAVGSREPRGYYRAVPDYSALLRGSAVARKLEADLSGTEGPDGTPRKVRVSRTGLCGADGNEYDEGLLKCSQIVLRRITASNVVDGCFEWYPGQSVSLWKTWA